MVLMSLLFEYKFIVYKVLSFMLFCYDVTKASQSGQPVSLILNCALHLSQEALLMSSKIKLIVCTEYFS